MFLLPAPLLQLPWQLCSSFLLSSCTAERELGCSEQAAPAQQELKNVGRHRQMPSLSACTPDVSSTTARHDNDSLGLLLLLFLVLGVGSSWYGGEHTLVWPPVRQMRCQTILAQRRTLHSPLVLTFGGTFKVQNDLKYALWNSNELQSNPIRHSTHFNGFQICPGLLVLSWASTHTSGRRKSKKGQQRER